MSTRTKVTVDVETNDAGEFVSVRIGDAPAIPLPLDKPAPPRLARELAAAAQRADEG